jgi:hypothetical protein
MKVKLIYFKSDTGKYYAEGSYDTKVDDLYDIWDEVEQMAKIRKLPGLSEGSYGWIISVDVPDHPHNHPKLILPES